MKNNYSINNLNSKINSSIDFMNNLRYEKYLFKPVQEGLTDAGSRLQLGFSCYGLKFFYLSGQWDKISSEDKENWVGFINSFQTIDPRFPKNSYIDKNYIYYLNKFETKKFLKDSIKNILNFTGVKLYDSKYVYEKKSVNAETKQAIATLYQVKAQNKFKVEPEFDSENVLQYLTNLDWSSPWASGAQYSAICVYSSTQNSYDKEMLKEFSDNLVDVESGFYFKHKPNNNRELFNGAMKIITGLDWIDHEIHYPKKIIDFCLKNRPIFEGCDVVDFIYVLNMCSKSINYKKDEVIKLLSELSEEMDVLFNNSDGGYSYFKNKSQTHYYGVEITEGLNVSDIHATLLCTWANVMILETIGELDESFKTLKP